ncbi:hypothetical protein F511_24540 [Dorcoceras hygrometricum]|uniref:Uncharacterized protein n=1 Tax=Dorcoceras hygrometricum TaxID=472368 RepID=A0A2Z7BTL5_9LAMI|nr:hypothetical protein F511_24540 [Dorcoceras hygrometricum]
MASRRLAPTRFTRKLVLHAWTETPRQADRNKSDHGKRRRRAAALGAAGGGVAMRGRGRPFLRSRVVMPKSIYEHSVRLIHCGLIITPIDDQIGPIDSVSKTEYYDVKNKFSDYLVQNDGTQLAVGPQPLRLRNHNFGLAQRIMVKRLETSPHVPLGITDSACKNQLVVVSVQYGPFNTFIPITSTTIGKSRVVRDPIAMHTSWRSNSDIRSVTSIGYPRMRASGESSTTKHRLLHASGSHPIPPPYDPNNPYNQDLGLIHSTNGNHLESPNDGSSIDHQVTIHLHSQNITMFLPMKHGTQLAVGPQPLRLRNHNFGLAQRIMVKRLETSPHVPLGITDSACKNQLVVVSVQYGPLNTFIPITSTTIGKSRVVRDPIAMHTTWRSNSDIRSVTRVSMTFRVVRSNQYNQDLGLIHSTNGSHLESPNDGSSIDHQVTIHLHAQNITMFPTNETWYFASHMLVSNSDGLILILTAQSTRNEFRIHSDY